jgi:Uma2 family endonuclease
MNTKTADRPLESPPRSVHRFSIQQYERLVRIGFLNPGDRAELIDGWLVDKMPHNPLHAGTVDLANKALEDAIPDEWTTRSQLPIRLPGNNAPEPDVVVVPAPKQRYLEGHPTEKDVVLVVEVSDTTLDEDRRLKLPQYARAKVPVYWIINLVDRRIEVYTEPRGGKSPTFKQQTNYGLDEEVPLVIGGVEVDRISVQELLPDV